MVTLGTSHSVMRMGAVVPGDVNGLLNLYGLKIERLDEGVPIIGSFWGASEAGITGTSVYIRLDTPVHSFLHETCHLICMSPGIRATYSGDAGSDDSEEAAVCYLQILLADSLSGVGRDRLMSDMDEWGYSFRCGSARGWFENDAGDSRQWLRRYELIDAADRPTHRLRSR